MKFPHWLALSAILSSGILLWSLREIVIQVFAGIVLAMAICTLVGKLRKIQPMPRALALIICLVSLLVILSIALIIVLPPFAEQLQQLIYQLPDAAKELWSIFLAGMEKLSEIFYGENNKISSYSQLLSNDFNPLPDGPTLAKGVGDGLRKILDFAGNLGLGLIQTLFIIVISLMISIQPSAYREVAILMVPSFYRRRARSVFLLCGDALSNWMFGLFISSLFVALLAGIGLSILGVKLVIANALLAGLLNIIPNFGPTISTIFPISVALLDNPWKAVAVLIMYIFIQNLESYLITPSIMHHQVKLLPGLTLVAQFVFTIIFGPIGLLLALPLAVVIQVLVKEVIIHDLLDPWKNKRISRQKIA